MIGYMQDVFLPKINAAVLGQLLGVSGYKVYYSYIALCRLLGAAAVFYFKKSTGKDNLPS